MFCIKSENEVEPIQGNHVGSPSVDDSSGPGSPFASSPPMKKGPWTSVEDAILMDYVKKHGEGNWNAVQKNTGLSRCGKSCRLRWANHLRPNLKKGAFTPEEEKLIIELHARMGNKWARMAAHLPGRTDNEIKNYWNTRIKRCQRANIPIYPSDICCQDPDEDQTDADEFSSGEKLNNDFYPGIGIFCPEYASDNFFGHSLKLPAVSISSLLGSPFGSRNHISVDATNGTKMLDEPVGLTYEVNDTTFCGYSLVGQLPSIKSRNSSINHHGNIDAAERKLAPYESAILGSHSLINGNFSVSRPVKVPANMELPSLQDNKTVLDDWLNNPVVSNTQTPNLVDTPLSSTATPVQSECISPRNSGLLEALIHEARMLGSSSNQALPRSSSSSICTPRSPIFDTCKEYWEEQSRPNSPLSLSSPFLVEENATPNSACSFGISSGYELPPAQISTGLSNAFFTGKPNDGQGESFFSEEYSQPLAQLGSSWSDERSQSSTNNKSLYKDVIAMLLGEDTRGENHLIS